MHTNSDSPRALSSENGQDWQQSGPVRDSEWSTSPDSNVVKLVLGQLDKQAEAEPWKHVLPILADGLKDHFPNLTHLHLWGLPMEKLGPLPEGLKVLDVRKCSALLEIKQIPYAELDTLVISTCPALEKLGEFGEMPHLYDLEISDSPRIQEDWLLTLVGSAGTQLRKLNLSGCELLTELATLPPGIVDLRLSRCENLVFAPPSWPAGLRRLELNGCLKLEKIPEFAQTLTDGESQRHGIDYLNLSNTPALKTPLHFPNGAFPRTLFLFGSGIPLDASLKGTSSDTNVARDVAADLQGDSQDRLPDHEVKLILLGNGRCGKTSLARQLVKDGNFDPKQKSTHGVKLWKAEFEFSPQDQKDGVAATAMVNIWDFAGQDLYHNTHRIFLESRAIYVICESDHGGGSCLEDDPSQEDPFDEEGFTRQRSYWEEQVESLERVGGVALADLVIRVKTKADRGGSPPGKDVIAVSAMKGTGLRQLEQEIRKRIALLLGKWQERSLPPEAMAVKQRLQAIAMGKEILKDGSDRRKLQESEAVSLIKSVIPDGPYHEDPKLLLRRFHRSGFLFHDENSFGGWVILDQRWALDGIYAIMFRDSPGNVREKLLVRRGEFTPNQLKTWVWDSLNYATADQELFIGLMQSCGTCFELLRKDETQSGEAVYVATGFLPPAATYEALVEEITDRPTEAFWKSVTIPLVSEAEMQVLVAWAGEHWGRSAKLWRWGCLLKVRDSKSEVLVDWRRLQKDDYAGEATFRFFGNLDVQLEAEIREKAEELFRHPENQKPGAFASLWRAPERVDTREQQGLSLESAKFPEKSSLVENLKADRVTRNGFRVTFSLAGGETNQEIPLRVVDLLKEHFKAKGFDPTECVLCYLPLEGEERLAYFTKQLAKGDLVVVFWSRKYFESTYCMPEVMWIYKAEPVGRLLDKRVRIYALDGESLATLDSLRPNVVQAGEFRRKWDAWVNDRAEKALREGGTAQGARKVLMRNPNLLEWHDFLLGGDEVIEPFIRALCDYRLTRTIKRQTGNDADEQAQALLEDVVGLLSDPLVLIDNAILKYQAGDIERAALFLQQAFASSGENNRDFIKLLESPGNTALPPAMLQAVLDFLNQVAGADQGSPS